MRGGAQPAADPRAPPISQINGDGHDRHPLGRSLCLDPLPHAYPSADVLMRHAARTNSPSSAALWGCYAEPPEPTICKSYILRKYLRGEWGGARGGGGGCPAPQPATTVLQLRRRGCHAAYQSLAGQTRAHGTRRHVARGTCGVRRALHGHCRSRSDVRARTGARRVATAPCGPGAPSQPAHGALVIGASGGCGTQFRTLTFTFAVESGEPWLACRTRACLPGG